MQQNRACCFEFVGKSMGTETTTWSEFPNGGKAIVEQILASEEIKKSKRAGLWQSKSGIWVGKLTIWVRSFQTEKLEQSSPGLSVPPEYVSQSLWWTLNSPKTNTLADGLIKRTSSMLDEIASKTVHKGKESDQYRKKK